MLEQLRSELANEHARRDRQLEELWDETISLVGELAVSSDGPAMPVTRISQPQALPLLLMEQIRNAKTSIELVHLEVGQTTSSGMELTMPAKLKALERGIESRLIYSPALLNQPALRKNVAQQLKAGAKVRATPAPTVQMFLFDGRSAVLIRPPGRGGRNAILVEESILVDVLYMLFDSWWAEAKDAAQFLGDSSPNPYAELSCEKRVLLHLLSDGLTDEAAAHKLGVSVRTVRRRVSALLRHLRAGSRFQAGVLVAKRGWL